MIFKKLVSEKLCIKLSINVSVRKLGTLISQIFDLPQTQGTLKI